MTELISYFSRSWPKTNHSGPEIIWQPGTAHDAIPSAAGPGGAPGDPRGSVRGPCGHIMRICSLHYPQKFPNGRVQLFKLRQTGLCSLSLSSTHCTRNIFPLSCVQIIALPFLSLALSLAYVPSQSICFCFYWSPETKSLESACEVDLWIYDTHLSDGSITMAEFGIAS